MEKSLLELLEEEKEIVQYIERCPENVERWKTELCQPGCTDVQSRVLLSIIEDIEKRCAEQKERLLQVRKEIKEYFSMLFSIGG